jgi:hypothetical protein
MFRMTSLNTMLEAEIRRNVDVTSLAKLTFVKVTEFSLRSETWLSTKGEKNSIIK